MQKNSNGDHTPMLQVVFSDGQKCLTKGWLALEVPRYVKYVLEQDMGYTVVSFRNFMDMKTEPVKKLAILLEKADLNEMNNGSYGLDEPLMKRKLFERLHKLVLTNQLLLVFCVDADPEDTKRIPARFGNAHYPNRERIQLERIAKRKELMAMADAGGNSFWNEDAGNRCKSRETVTYTEAEGIFCHCIHKLEEILTFPCYTEQMQMEFSNYYFTLLTNCYLYYHEKISSGRKSSLYVREYTKRVDQNLEEIDHLWRRIALLGL